MNEELMNKINDLHDELVPVSGKSESRAGELVRAACRIGYRFFNDGDMIGVGYGKETCNPAARFLLRRGSNAVAGAIDELLDWNWNEDEYEDRLDDLVEAVLEQINEHPELRNEPTEDMWSHYDPEEDRDDEEEDDEDDWEEDQDEDEEGEE